MKLYGLKNIRNIYGFTMRDLAKRINVSSNLINLWERGDVDVPEYRVDNLSHYLGIEKELLFKENHDIKDLMLIEIARSNFKINEYRDLIEDDKESIKAISEMLYNANESEFEYQALQSLIEKLIKMYSILDVDEYDEFDDIIRDLIDSMVSDKNKWKRFKIMYESIHGNEDMESWEDDYSLFCDVEQLLKKQIKDNVEQLFKKEIYDKVENVLENQIRENSEQLCKKKLYEQGKYKPYWEDEE